MSLSVTVKHVKAMAEVLSAEYDSVEDASRAAIEEGWRLYEERGNWITVGQIRYTDGRFISADDGRAAKVALGPFATRGQAVTAGEQLAVSMRTGEEYRYWCLQIHHGTPALLHKARQEAQKAAKLIDDDADKRIADAKAFSANNWPQEMLQIDTQ